MKAIQTNSITKVIGACLLVTGSCIGAGMLGMPVLTADVGFYPSIIMFFVCWAFMTATGLLLLEVNLWFKREVSIISMVENTLGKTGKIVAWGTYLFLFYCLTVAYVSGSGALFSNFFMDTFSIEIPIFVGSLLFILLFGMLVYYGTQAVDQFNRLLMFGLVISYILLVILGSQVIQPELLTRKNWSVAPFVIPAMVITFGFHNLVPSLTTYLNRNEGHLKKVFLIGSLLSLGVYLIWQRVMLGIVSFEGTGGMQEALSHGEIATQALRRAVGKAWIVDIAEYFAFFAIVTSFLGVALSFVDFLFDGLKLEKTKENKIFLCSLVLVPPFIIAIFYPNIFLTALSVAGGFGAVILFGVLPVLMAWRGRYILQFKGKHLLPGGKVMLMILLLFSIAVIGITVFQQLFPTIKGSIS